MTPRIDTQPDLPPLGDEQLLAAVARMETIHELAPLRTHTYDCDYMRIRHTGLCTCGDAA